MVPWNESYSYSLAYRFSSIYDSFFYLKAGNFLEPLFSQLTVSQATNKLEEILLLMANILS